MGVIYIKIAVLTGGTSSERQVSLRSGQNIANALIRLGHTVAPIDPSRPVSLSENIFTTDTRDIDARFALFSDTNPKESPQELDISVIFALKYCDRVFIALHGGAGEDGRLQSLLELLKVPYNGSPPLGCALAMDKIMTKRVLESSGILTPAYTVSVRGVKIRQAPKYPCVVKPSNGGSSVGTFFVDSQSELSSALEKAHRYCNEVLIENVIKGRELTVGVLNGEPLAVTEIIPRSSFYDYDSKYIVGATEEITPARISKETEHRALGLSKRVHELLGLRNFSRTDMIYDEKSELLYILEANALPGMTDTSLFPQMAAYKGISFDQLCERMM